MSLLGRSLSWRRTRGRRRQLLALDLAQGQCWGRLRPQTTWRREALRQRTGPAPPAIFCNVSRLSSLPASWIGSDLVTLRSDRSIHDWWRYEVALMPQPLRFEVSGDDFFAHAVQKQQCGGLAIAAQEFRKRGGKRRLGHDFRLDPCAKCCPPRLRCGFRLQSDAFPRGRVRPVRWRSARHSTHSPFHARRRIGRNLSNPFNVPLILVAQPASDTSSTLLKK